VEAGLPSGTFSTADTTLAMGKDVLVVPGSIHSKESYGSNQLLLQGALPVVDDQSFVGYLTDILGSSVIEAQTKRILDTARATDRERAGLQISEIEAALISKPMSVEEISALWGGDVTATIRELSALEFIGKIVRLRDGRYTISESCRYTV
jgi:DNA processing protein